MKEERDREEKQRKRQKGGGKQIEQSSNIDSRPTAKYFYTKMNSDQIQKWKTSSNDSSLFECQMKSLELLS